jgi:pseudouridine-5'-phosphate glycosidase
LYFLVLFRKSSNGRFDYATKFNRNLAKELEVSLPITEQGDIDFEFMEKYIRAIEKKVIKSVIDWKDKVISTTKEVVAFSDKDNMCIGI